VHDAFCLLSYDFICIISQQDGFLGSTQKAPQVTILPRYLDVQEGSPVEFHCEATGNPAPTLRWNIGGNKQLNPEVSHVEAAVIIQLTCKFCGINVRYGKCLMNCSLCIYCAQLSVHYVADKIIPYYK